MKLKNILIDKVKILAIVLLLIMVFSGFWMYKASTEPLYEEKNVTSYTQRGNYIYSASVTKPNSLYPVGTKLEMGKPAYFYSISPIEDVSFEYSLEAAESADLSVDAKTVIVVRSKKEYEEGQRIFWQKSYEIGESKSAQLKSGDVLTYNFTLDVPTIRAKAKGVQDQLIYSSDSSSSSDTGPDPVIQIVTTVNYKGEINGEDVTGTKDYIIPVHVSSNYYEMPHELGFIEEKHKIVRVEQTPSLSIIKFPLFLFLLSMVMLGAIIPVRRMSKVDPEYIERLEKERKSSSFKEFISEGKLPEERRSLLHVEISSLQGIVDAATDMNERVIHDTGSGTYFIIHNGALYIFYDAP
ncbi:DUF5305 family protein [Methanosarcina mazei]|uniref:DUF5305 domain-containing protein n=1 Tax=Methanosarcina mazei WWM610 TaxID=1434117 RepID=A0A0E3LEV5_METMZ|nr:DUF5305 family protein [Methanosarcina mazei]AKB39681.1 hypothetical protein MSMAW_0690 [Methanosarcina mazei WWM610]